MIVQALHLTSDVYHLIQRRRDQTREADDVAVFFFGHFQNLVGRDHHAQINHFEVITLQHDTHDVLTDIVYVALNSRHQDFALRLRLPVFFSFDIGQQVSDGLFHNSGAFYHLWQEHFT